MTDNSSAAKADNSGSAGTPPDGEDNAEVTTGAEPPRYHPPPQEGFGWRGWLLVGIILVSFLVVPGAILYLPYAQGFIARVGISWRQAYLALPMIPALLLGGIAIWAAVTSRRETE